MILPLATQRTSLATDLVREPFLRARDNPLCIEQVTRIAYRFFERDWDWHLSRLEDLGYRAAVVGPQGTGKTTLLLGLEQRLNRLGNASQYLLVPRQQAQHAALIDRIVDPALSQTIWIVDGIERLSLPNRHRVFRRTRTGSGLVVALHRPPRFLNRIPLWIQSQRDPNLMVEILVELNLDFPEVQQAGQIAWNRHQGNVRLALRELYDQFSAGRFNRILSS